MMHFVAYHEALDPRSRDKQSRRGPIADGLMIVCATSDDQAREIVMEALGPDFNRCLIEPLKYSSEPQIQVEFWRQAPKRVEQPRAPDHELDTRAA